MSSDERDIFYFLKSQCSRFVPQHHICRHAGGRRRFVRKSDWALPVLAHMIERGILESDGRDGFRISVTVLNSIEEKRRQTKWMSPSIGGILKSSKMGKWTEFLNEDAESSILAAL